MRLGYPASVYIDTNAVIRSIEGDESALVFLIEHAAADLMHLYTSELTLAEVLVGPFKSENLELVARYEEFLTSDEFLEVVPVDRTVLRRSAEIRAAHGTKALDSIHIATALVCDCKVVSSDQRLHMPPGLTRVSSSAVGDFEDWP